MKIEKGGKHVKQEQIYKYKDCFCGGDRRIYLQGEPGSGKSYFAAKLVHDWCNAYAPIVKSKKEQMIFGDVDTLQKFKFLFFISLRDSREQTHVTQMIKTQLIYKIYAEEEWKSAYKLVLKIMKNIMFLIIQDGLDEWPCKEALPSMEGILKDQCIVLTTSRPWKLADERIRNSQIDILFDLEGISDPKEFNEKILRCLLDESTDIKKNVELFEKFLKSRKLKSISSSPMLNTLVLCTWVDDRAERLTGSSLCELYTTMLENMCKKANAQISYFEQCQLLPVNCFVRTKYIRPNMEHIDSIAKAAFSFLFSNEKESSIVFSDVDLTAHLPETSKQFALDSGLLSKRKGKKCSIQTFSFVHKTIQEFLTAFYIHRNADVIDDVISGYLKLHDNAYHDIYQIFVFLCGFNITAANKLSALMNDAYNAFSEHFLQDFILSGYREALANKNTPIHLHLSHFDFNEDNAEELIQIWTLNTSRARSLDVLLSSNSQIRQVTIRSQDAVFRLSLTWACCLHARKNPGPSTLDDEKGVRSSTSCIEFNLSSCHNLELLKLMANVTVLPNALVGLKKLKHLEIWSDCKCEALDLSSCHNLERLELKGDVTVLPKSLVGLKKLKNFICLLSICKKLDSINLSGEEVETPYNKCNELDLSNCKNLKSIHLRGELLLLPNALVGLKKLKNLTLYLWYFFDCDEALDLSGCKNLESIDLGGNLRLLPNALMGLKKLKNLTLQLEYVNVLSNEEVNFASKALDLSHFEHIESIAIDIYNGVHLLPLSVNNYKTLKCIQVGTTYYGLNLSMFENLNSIKISKNVKVLPKPLLIHNMLTHIELHQFDFNHVDNKAIHTWCLLNGADPVQCADYTPVLPHIEHIEFEGVTCSSTWLRSLLSTLLTLDHSVTCSMRKCNITSFDPEVKYSLRNSGMTSCVEDAASESHATGTTITADLNNTCTFKVWNRDCPGLWETLHGQNVKHLRLHGSIAGLEVYHVPSLSRSLASLSQLETLIMQLSFYIDLQLPPSLKHLTVCYDTLSPSDLRLLVNKLCALTPSVKCRLEFSCGNKITEDTVNYNQPEEYIPIQQELEALEHVKVKRFRIYDRTPNTYIWSVDAWSVRDSVVDDGDNSDEIGDDESCISDINWIDNSILNRISMRLQIN